MKFIEIKGQIEDIEADALVYSTNQNLRLTGGVGASLFKRYGYPAQAILDKHLSNLNTDTVDVGSIFEGTIEGMPWKRVFHTVATDLNYETNPEIVRDIIKACLESCESDYSINSIAFSALGSGFGSLKYPEFVKILNKGLEPYYY